MAKELLKTPLATVRWCKLVGPARPNTFDPSKPDSWSTDLILDNKDKSHMAWLMEMEAQYAAIHGEARMASHAFPWSEGKKDSEDDGKTIVKFKVPEFTRKDGTKSEGPTLFDAAKNPWDHKKMVGNGSKLIIAFDIYGWKSPSGCGMTFQPRFAQVVELVEYVDKGNPDELFGIVPGGFVDPDQDAIPF
jgi:hypothetical protein